MSKPSRILLAGSLALFLGGCATDVMAPNGARSFAGGAGRAPTSSFGSWPTAPDRIDLFWPDEVSNETGWEIHRSTTGPAGTFTLRATLPANSITHTDSGLTAQTEYCYQARSFRKQGTRTTHAEFSNVSCSATLGPPVAPSDVSTVPGVWGLLNVTVTWMDRSDDEQAFRIERALQLAGPWEVLATVEPVFGLVNRSYVDSRGVGPEQLLCYRVVGFNAWGETASNVDCTASPRTPSGVTASSANAQSIDVSWQDDSNFEDGYEIQRQVANGTWDPVAVVPANSTTFRDAAVAVETVYHYRIRAMRDGGFSDYSVVVARSVASRAPDAPLVSYASPAGSSAAAIRWERESALAAEFRVERSSDGRATWQAIATLAPTSSGLLGTGEFRDDGLTAEREYCYRVIARNTLGDSPPSNVDCTTPPAAPGNLAFTTGEGGAQLVTWTDNSQVETGYLVLSLYCWPNEGNCTDTFDAVYPANTTSISLSPDQFGRDQYFEAVCAIYDGGLSDCVYFWNASLMTVTPGAAARRPGGSARSNP